MVVGGSDREVLVDAGDVRCKLLFATERWIDCSYWKEREVFGEKGSENKRLAWCKINKSIDNERQDVERPTHDDQRTEICSILQNYERFEVVDLLVTSYINCLFHNLIVELVCYH